MSDLRMAVGKFAWKLGCPNKYDGYRYLLDGICIAFQSSGEIICLRKAIYEELANKYHTDTRNIERCIRHLINRWWDEHRCGQLFTKKPTNSELICFIVEYLRLGMGACKTCFSKGIMVCECEAQQRHIS